MRLHEIILLWSRKSSVGAARQPAQAAGAHRTFGGRGLTRKCSVTLRDPAALHGLTSQHVGIYFFHHFTWRDEGRAARSPRIPEVPGGPAACRASALLQASRRAPWSVVPPCQQRRTSVNVPLRLVLPVLGLTIALFQGCTLRPQNIKLDPPVDVGASNVGQGKVVWVQVRDARVRKTLGNVGDPEGKFTQVSVDDDFSSTVYQR